MAFWLMKTEPEEYSYNDLVRLGQDRWNGVRNFTALNHMRNMNPGDQAFIYHTGKEKAITGVAEIVSKAYPDPTLNDLKFLVIDLVPKYPLIKPVSLKKIKETPLFSDWELVRLSRLSVMPVKEIYWQEILKMAGMNIVFIS